MSEVRVEFRFWYQLDRNLPVHVYRKDEVEGVRADRVACRDGQGRIVWSLSREKDETKPAVFTVKEAFYLVRYSFFPGENFYIEPA